MERDIEGGAGGEREALVLAREWMEALTKSYSRKYGQTEYKAALAKIDAVLAQPASQPAVGGDYQHGYADGIEWATVHAQPASPLRKALQRAYDFLQDKSFMPDALTHECTKVLEQMEEALAAECPLCPGFSTACGNSNCPQLAQPASPLRGRDELADKLDQRASVHEYAYNTGNGDTYRSDAKLMREASAALRSASPPEQPAADNVKTLLETIDAKNARIGELEEALANAVLAPEKETP